MVGIRLQQGRRRRCGFTLIELLVVVAVICMLVAILLPSLSQAKKYSKTIRCASQLKQIDITMNTYASEYEGAILGNAHTSGGFLLQTHVPAYSETYCPYINQCWDWSGPVAAEMGLNFEQGPLTANRQTRFVQLNKAPAFLCPENDIIATNYTGSPFTVSSTAMVSYNTASCFQYGYGGGATYWETSHVLCSGYLPKVGLVGNPAGKIFIADGARWSDDGVSTPDVNLGYLGSGTSPGGHYAEWGPWSAYSRAYLAPSGITFAMRHGSRRAKAPLNAYRFNAAFFDGHVETLDGATGSNPALWAPSGATIPAAEFTTSFAAIYASSGSFQVP